MTQLIDSGSQMASRAEVDFFSIPPTQVAVDSGYWTEIFPTHVITDNGPYTFRIPPDPNYLDISKNYIKLEFSLRKAADGSIPDAAGEHATTHVKEYEYGVINLIAKTFFRHVKIFFNNKLVEDSSDVYGYKSFIETLLNHSWAEKESILKSALWYQDDATVVDKMNSGFRLRCAFTDKGDSVQVVAPIHAAVFNQNRLLLSHVDVRVEMHRNNDAFCLMNFGNTNLKVHVESLSWFVRKVEVTPSLALGVETYLTKNPAKYPIRRFQGATVNIDKTKIDMPNIILTNGILPRRVLITFVDSAAFFGEKDSNPFYFKPYDVKSITLTAGDRQFPRNMLELDFKNQKYMQGYMALMEALNATTSEKNIGITPAMYTSGCYFDCQDLTPDSTDNDYWDLQKMGTLSAKVVFRTALTKDLKMLYFVEYDNVLAIDKNRNIILDYSV